MLEIGTKAPDFTLEDQNGEKHSLSDYKGKKVVLYFYPKDNTPGCTNQALLFTELKAEFDKKNTVILGISKDSVKSHKKFEEKHNLGITILSDESLDVINKYEVWKEKKNYGKTYMGIVRSTYLIDENGLIKEALENVKAKDNPRKMLDLI